MNRHVPKARAEAEAYYPPNSVKNLGDITCRAPMHEPNDETERPNVSHLGARAVLPWGQAEGEQNEPKRAEGQTSREQTRSDHSANAMSP